MTSLCAVPRAAAPARSVLRSLFLSCLALVACVFITPASAQTTTYVKPVLVVDPVTALSSSTWDTEIRVHLGARAMTGWFSDPAKFSVWSVELFYVNADGTLTSTGLPPVQNSSAGVAPFYLRLPLGPVRLVAMAKPATPNNPLYGTPTEIRSNMITVWTRNGTAIPATLSVRGGAISGPVPYRPTLMTMTTDPMRRMDVYEVAYMVSKAGSGYVPLMTQPVAGTNVAPTQIKGFFVAPAFTEEGTYNVQAILINKYSQEVSETNPVTITVFGVPKVTVSGPNVTVTGHPVTLSATLTNQLAAPVQYDWTVSKGFMDLQPQTFTGQSITLTPTEPGVLLVAMKARETTAPETNRFASKRTMNIVRVMAPTLPRPLITGPTVVETGKTYEWTVVQREMFPPNSGTNLVKKFNWTLPDGTTVTPDSNTVRYTMKAGDRNSIVYRSYLEGVEFSNANAELLLKPWAYQFPAMSLVPSVTTGYPGVHVRYSVLATGTTLPPNTQGEKFTYAWQFSEGGTGTSAEVISTGAGAAEVQYNEVGSFTAGVTVSDTRGNTVTLTSPPTVVQAPRDPAITVSVVYADQYKRAPTTATVRVVPTALPQNDSVIGSLFEVNGTLLSRVPSTTNSAALTFNEPGIFYIRAILLTARGARAEQYHQVVIVPQDKPVCDLKATQSPPGTAISLTLTSYCRVSAGRIVSYRWATTDAASNAVTQTAVTASQISFNPNQVAMTSKVELTATTDRGATGRAIYDVSTGTVTVIAQ